MRTVITTMGVWGLCMGTWQGCCRGMESPGAVVNGTCEGDWGAVEGLCARVAGLRPAFGLHPWRVAGRSAGWEGVLRGFLERNAGATVGEVGLDGWVEGHDLEDQKGVFVRQWGLARERGCAVTVHCLRAHEPLRQVLAREGGLACGFLLHAWGGPAAMVPRLLEQGAHFSFPAYFLHERKGREREMFRGLPEERLLIETDAPDLVPPPGCIRVPLAGPEGAAVNHPGNLAAALEGLAEIRGVSAERLRVVTGENWRRLFAGGMDGDGSAAGGGA